MGKGPREGQLFCFVISKWYIVVNSEVLNRTADFTYRDANVAYIASGDGVNLPNCSRFVFLRCVFWLNGRSYSAKVSDEFE